ncbi:MAG: flagellar biosynthetic protein FliO [Bacteroidota bacterium]
MRNIFPVSRRKDKPRTTGNQLFKRSIALGAALLLLWVALTVMPKASIATEPVVISDEAGTVATSATASTTTTDSPWDLGKITAGLLLAGLLGFATYWQKKQSKQQIHAGNLNTLGKLQLGPGQLVHLVQCGEEAVLVGTSNNQITLLHHFSRQNLAKPAPAATPAIPAPTYSSPSTTAANNDNFGVLLQQQNLLSTATLDVITKDALKPVPQS